MSTGEGYLAIKGAIFAVVPENAATTPAQSPGQVIIVAKKETPSNATDGVSAFHSFIEAEG